MRRTSGALFLLVLAGCSQGGGSGGGAASVVAPATSAAPVAAPVAAPAAGTAAPGSTVASPAAPAPGPVRPALQAPAGAWLKGDFHVHSSHSGDAAKYGDDVGGVIRCAERAGLDFTTITDHRSSACLTDPLFTSAKTPLILIPGEEWGQPGHAGAHGLTRPPILDAQDETQGAALALQKLQATIDDIHSMGGIFVVNHPIDTGIPWLWPIDRFDGVEVWNTGWAIRNATDATTAQAQSWAQGHGFAAGGIAPWPETMRALQVTGGGQNWQRLKLYEQHLSSGRHVAAVGGSDAHYLFLPGMPTTLVFAEQKNAAGILDGVRHSRTQVLRSPTAPVLEFTADRDGDGTFETILGDSIPVGKAVTFKIHVKNADQGKLDLVRNGTVVQHWAITSPDFEATFTDSPSARSWYRVDCWEKLDMSFPKADTLRKLVLGSQPYSWLTALGTTGLLNGKLAAFAANAQKVLDSGGPTAIWLLLNGHQLGIKVSNANTTFPRLELPDNVQKVLNVAVHDQDYCASVVTSPIWIE